MASQLKHQCIGIVVFSYDSIARRLTIAGINPGITDITVQTTAPTPRR
mgnify:CR=1 FL=1